MRPSALRALAGATLLLGLCGCAPPAPPGPTGAAPAPSVSVTEAPLYCYRTMAEVTCYAAPDPQAAPGRLVQ